MAAQNAQTNRGPSQGGGLEGGGGGGGHVDDERDGLIVSRIFVPANIKTQTIWITLISNWIGYKESDLYI